MIRLVLAAWLALCGVANAQLSGGVGGFPGPGTVHSTGVTCSSSEGNAFLTRATLITNNTDKTNYCALIDGLVTDGLCCAATGGVLDALYIFAAPDSTTAKLNLTQNAFNATQTGSLTFAAAQGFTGDGTTGFLDTGFNLLTAGGNYAQDSSTIGCYSLTSRTVDQNYTMLGASNGRATRIVGKQAAGPGGAIYEVNSNAGTSFFTTANAQGSWLATRTASNLTTLYKNGSSVATTAGVSGSRDSLNLYMFAINNAGAAGAFSADKMSACFIGAGMNGTQAGNMQSRLNTFMTAYSINVY